ncbi:hypothetical protein F0U61_47915 [Archangium violaceum]|uniref:hypothetical protein n=1 Tax=Archangium violaceum TaxID=83451 RepID=UPI002B31562D|nr:hypothetical protein F0U61_47915 [Archangium violaceum]
MGSAYAASDFERYLTDATRLYEELEYEKALEQLARAREVARGEEEVTVTLYEGILFAELNKWEQARASFLTALLLNPQAKLPVRVSPKLSREFEAQRERARQVLAKRTPSASASSPGSSRSSPASAPGGVTTDRPEQKSKQGARLMPETPPAPTGLVEVRQPARRVPIVPLVLLGAGVVAAGAGTAFGLASRDQVDAAWGARYQSEVISHQAQAQRSARTANILFGTAGAAAVGALVSWLLMPSPAAPSSGETR